ncbi:hypothetical protein GGI12_006177, partial [Dipsacomyces acuminosporus]
MVLKAGEISKGVELAFEATQFAAQHKRVQTKFLDALKYTVVGMAVVHIVLYILVFFPLFLLQAGNHAMAAVLRYDASQTALALVSTSDAVSHFLDSLPLLAVDLITHIKPGSFEAIFFAMLDEISPDYAKTLRSWPPKKHHWSRIKFTMKRILKRYLMTLA